MNIVEAVKRYVVDRYPIESSWTAWRSGESIAAVALLTQRVNGGNAAGLLTAVNYLADRTPAVGDGPVAALREISRTTLTGAESRLYAMLLDVKAALAFPADFVMAHAEKVWRANSLFCLVGAHDDTLDAKGWIAYFFMERQQWNHVPQRSREWMVDFLNVFYDRPVQLALANGGAGPGLASAYNATQFLQNHELPERTDGAQTVMARMESYTPIQITHAYRPKADVFEEAMVVALRSGFMPIAECTDRTIVGPPRLAQVQLHTAWRTNPAWGVSAATAQAFAATFVRQTAVVSYCWRGDGRGYGEIRDARGLWCKAASQAYAERTKMREAWHPFHREEYRRHIYYRCNQNDNCLFTAVSVTPAVTIGGVGNAFQFGNPDPAAFQINVTFPQLSTIPVPKRRRVHVDRTGTGANVGQNDTQQLYVDHVQLYLCRIPALAHYVRHPRAPDSARRGRLSGDRAARDRRCRSHGLHHVHARPPRRRRRGWVHGHPRRRSVPEPPAGRGRGGEPVQRSQPAVRDRLGSERPGPPARRLDARPARCRRLDDHQGRTDARERRPDRQLGQLLSQLAPDLAALAGIQLFHRPV